MEYLFFKIIDVLVEKGIERAIESLGTNLSNSPLERKEQLKALRERIEKQGKLSKKEIKELFAPFEDEQKTHFCKGLTEQYQEEEYFKETFEPEDMEKVLNAVTSGYDTVEKIAKNIHISKDIIQSILDQLYPDKLDRCGVVSKGPPIYRYHPKKPPKVPKQKELFNEIYEFHQAVEKCDSSKIITMLEKRPSLINAKIKGGKTPLHTAVLIGKKDIVELLISQRAEINVEDKHNRTPLHYAAHGGYKDIEEILKRE